MESSQIACIQSSFFLILFFTFLFIINKKIIINRLYNMYSVINEKNKTYLKLNTTNY